MATPGRGARPQGRDTAKLSHPSLLLGGDPVTPHPRSLFSLWVCPFERGLWVGECQSGAAGPEAGMVGRNVHPCPALCDEWGPGGQV